MAKLELFLILGQKLNKNKMAYYQKMEELGFKHQKTVVM